ncbi:MAG: polyphosphate polymerase domain-containing protein [Clostridia bacterium]|nr:polyphosphate polymerase domain-containing protein [Clostridia bacterium]
MPFQSVFKRYELKFILDKHQKEKILSAMEPYMEKDKYGRTTICNVYFDTSDYRLIRRSIEKPVYKEKLRVRKYVGKNSNENVFVELKKKYKKVVYKRRLCMNEEKAFLWLMGEQELDDSSQIAKEIKYFLSYYSNLKPAVFLSYEREAYYSKDESDFRVTFDENILTRDYNFSFKEGAYGDYVLPRDKVLMEIKCSSGIPLWMTSALSKEKIYKTSFSKYGTAYSTKIFPKINGGIQND